MTTTKTAFAAGTALLLAAGAVAAQPVLPSNPTTPTAPVERVSPDARVGIVDIDPRLNERRVDELKDMSVYSADGRDIGEIEQVVRRGGQLYAVMEAGGILGIGARELAVPLDRFRFQGDRLTLPMTKAEFEAMEDYASEEYERLDGGTVGGYRSR